MRLFEVIKNNAKAFMFLGMIVLLGTIGITYSLIISKFRAINVNATTINLDAIISYDADSNGAEIINNGNLLPISDDLVTIDTSDTRVIKVAFNVTGVDSNPDNTIYDIALYGTDIACELRTEDLKWRLYKNSILLSEGNLSPTFDTMANNRLVLTNTQEDLTVSTDSYVFLLWISESCNTEITSCDTSLDQSSYLNRSLNASIKVELSTKSKKVLERVTGSTESCTYIAIDVPVCNNLTYTGTEQTLVDVGSNYTLINNTAIEVGKYAVTVRLNDGYKWSDGGTEDKILYCNIN